MSQEEFDGGAAKRTFGHYTLLEELGRGGQGTVWLAEDHRLKRKVALKLLRTAAGAVDDQQLERFRREAEAASKLDHPNICALFDAGDVDGEPYIAFRHIDGETLAERIRAGQQTGSDSATGKGGIQATVGLFEKLARALHQAHEQGLIHRDVKPGNIILTADGEPIVLDFGLARDELADEQTLTHSGDLLGTPAYMSPEQLMAQRIPLDRRTDVYSLGATLYECLTLERPYQAVTRAELYQRILTTEPSSATGLNRQIPRDLAVVLQTAMEKDRDRRYQTAADFADDLRRIRTFEPIRARPIGRLLRLRRWAQRHPALAVAALALIAALAASLAVLEQTRRSLRHTRAVALASASAQVREGDPTLSLLLAREAVALEQTSETMSPLHQGLAAHRERAVLRHDARVQSSSSSPDGHVLTTSADRTAKIWDRDGGLLHVLRHGAALQGGEFSPDGKTIATASADGQLSVWTAKGQPLATCQAHAGKISHLEFAPGGEAVLTASDDGTARLWDLEAGQLAQFDHGARLLVAAFSPDGRSVLTTASCDSIGAVSVRDSTVAKLWNRSGELLARLEGHTDSIGQVAFSSSGDRIATTSDDRTARLWDLQGNSLCSMQHPARPMGVTFQDRADSCRVLTGCLDGRLRVWDLDGQLRDQRRVHGSGLTTVVASQDGDRLLTSSWDQTAQLLDVDGDPLAAFTGHLGPLERDSVSFLVDGSGVLTHSSGHTARLWDVQIPGLPLLRGFSGGVSSAAFSRDDRHILTAAADSSVRTWSDAGQLIRVYPGHSQWVNQAVYSHDGEIIASASDDGTTRLWKTADGARLHVLRTSTRRSVHSVAFDFDDSMLAQCSSDGTAEFWDVRSGRSLARIGSVDDAEFWFGEFAPSRPWFVTGQADGMVKIWDVADLENVAVIQQFDIGPATAFEAVFSPDGERIAAASGDGTARIWHLSGGAPVICYGHQGGVMGCAFSPDGSMLATASRDGTARIWSSTGRELAILRGHEGPLWDVRFSADGKRLVTASFDMTVRTWIVDPSELLDLVDRRLDRLGRTFTPAEIARFGHLLGR